MTKNSEEYIRLHIVKVIYRKFKIENEVTRFIILILFLFHIYRMTLYSVK